MEKEFKIMSDGENIDKKLNYETRKREELKQDTKINIIEYSNMINFCIKDSIFNYYEIPVIVICCFGTQSIGKSTFLNELTGSLFNVSGMRCTEGIWMSIKLFNHSIEEEKRNCNRKCKNCEKNKCCLLNHEIGKKGIICLCKECKCDKDCILNIINNKKNNNCDLKCCFKKDHDNLIKCSYEGCQCKCVCECICDKFKYRHSHFCYQCKKEKKNCDCDCNCKHFCKIPILLHHFLCVCLDFEGLGTFERTKEQDIQMALVGSALGNSVIFRTGNSYDRFTENTLEKMALGSNKIKNINIEQFFGGSLIFSPKDVIDNDRNKLKKEFNLKIENSIKKWNSDLIRFKKRKKKYSIFGLFEDNVFAPTPKYLDDSFYNTLRNTLIPDIIENTLKYQRHPNYKTGKEFSSNLKLFLSAVYMNEFEFLTDYDEKMIKNYIYENIKKAFEIGGKYKELDDSFIDKDILIGNDNKHTIYFNNDYIDNFEVNLSYNNKFENNNMLIIDNIYSNIDIHGIYKIQNYGLNVKIDKIEKSKFLISIDGLNDFGLILLIPNEIKDIINYDYICSFLFKLWDSIFKKIGLDEKSTISYFSSFISSIIKRRNDNIFNWLKELTKNYKNLESLQNQYSPLENKWILCKGQCKYCYNKCYLLQGHENEHKCPYDHKCKEKCHICLTQKCNDKKCKNICNKKSGHSDIHICNHFHQCKENCNLKDFSSDCKGRCIFEYGHKEYHNCGLNSHHCKENCILNRKAKKCRIKCNLPYPHEGIDHNCGKIHYCKEKCYLKDKSLGCKSNCILEYGHKNRHYCGEKHLCKEKCILNTKAKNCGESCNLLFPHEGKEHDCCKNHLCFEKCNLQGKALHCKQFCILIYGHKEKHDCGGIHYCKEKCCLLNKTKNCGRNCYLTFPHEGKDHFCGNNHLCNGICSLFDKSRNCKKQCYLEYNHKNKCICNLPKEKHLCNKKCNISEKCNKDCILISGHEGNCLCGKCNCPYPCKYKGDSRNCYKKCQFKAGHSGDEHYCTLKKNEHICKEICHLKEKSRNCNNLCALEIKHEGEHFCLNEHLCINFCQFYKESRNCNEHCSLKFNHEGNHFCEIPLNEHLCKYFCDLYEKSRECNKNCNKPVNHTGDHLCSLQTSEHICNNKCSLYNNSREGCKENCYLQAGHKGSCFCENQKSDHKCNQLCALFDKSYGCQKYCELPSSHENPHKCSISEEDHLCKGICSLSKKARGNCFNNSQCCLPYGHKEYCICSTNHQHFCNEKCSLYKNSRKDSCNKLCHLIFGHSGEHYCSFPREKHFCPNNCYYYNKSKGICNQYCSLPFQHKDICICKEPNNHLCNKECSLFNLSGGCSKDCSLIYGHKGNCFCNSKYHTCKEKCILCKKKNIEMDCGHVYNHIKEYLFCYKCDKECELFLDVNLHLCGGQHDCPEKCEIGCCEIINYVKQEEQTYKSKSGEEIKNRYIKFQEINKKQCIIKIPKNKCNHESSNHANGLSHTCGSSSHKCGIKCQQCEYCCTEPIGHSGLHNSLHGNIKNSNFSVINNIALVRKDNKSYKFTEGETAIIFFCDEYCREQGQGHTHLFESNIIIKEDNNIHFYKIENDKFIYECKCSYFWENILKFKSNFSSDENKRFSLCNWKCKYESHEPPEYCQLPLWHNKVNEIPKGMEGSWISKGHIFKCFHPIAVYSIFLVDQSGSMMSNSSFPTNSVIKNKMNNMLGASIQAIDDFCKKRASLNPKENVSLIGFNDKANNIFTNLPIYSNEIISNCLEKLKPEGITLLINAFKQAKNLIEYVDRKEYVPIIILLTDGLGHDHEKTIDYIENEVSYNYY